MNKNTEQFQWTDELVKEYGDWFKQRSDVFSPNPLFFVEQFIKSKQSKVKKEQPLWEILSFRGVIQPEVVWSILQNGKYKYLDSPLLNTEYTLEYMIEAVSDGNIKIESVKRLSDGEVFTVGDMVGWGVYKDFQTKLLKFIINDNGVLEFKYMNFANRYSCVDFINAYELYKVKEEAPKEEQVPIKVKVRKYFNSDCILLIESNKPIPESKYQSIKSAIEDVLNEDKIKHEKLLSKIESKVRLANMINTQANYLKETLDYINSLK